jgi:hypothetical protein
MIGTDAPLRVSVSLGGRAASVSILIKDYSYCIPTSGKSDKPMPALNLVPILHEISYSISLKYLGYSCRER